jgi:hypothetical protein
MSRHPLSFRVRAGRPAHHALLVALGLATGLGSTHVSAQLAPPVSSLSIFCPGGSNKPLTLVRNGAGSLAQVYIDGAWRDLRATGEGGENTWVFRSLASEKVKYTLSMTDRKAVIEGPGDPLTCSVSLPVVVLLGPKARAASEPAVSSEPAAWRVSEQQLIEGRRRLDLMDYAGARSRFEAAWATLEAHSGWTAEWGSRVLWDLGYSIALTCRDYQLAYDKLRMAWSMAVTGTPHDLGRQMRIRREQARVAYQAGMWRLAADDYTAIRPLFEPILRQRSALLVAEFDEEYAMALRRAGDEAQAQEAAARAAQIRASTPPNPLMQRAGPTLQQVCGEPGKP